MSTTLILYGARKCLSSDHQPIRAGKSVIWIRVTEVSDISLMDALDIADPLPGEIVLNTIHKTGRFDV